MTPASPVHKLLLTAAGLLLGILLYLFYFVGGFLTLAGFLVERATQPLPQTGAMRDTGTMQQELLKFLESLELGYITMIGEESLDRAVSAMTLLSGEEKDPDQAIAVKNIRLDLEPGELHVYTDIIADSPAASFPGWIRLRPISTKVRTDFQVLPDKDGIILSFRDMSLSKLNLPKEITGKLFAALMPDDPGLPFSRTSGTSFSLPYGELQQVLPPGLRLESLEARKDALAVSLRIDPGLRETVLGELSALARKEGPGFTDAVAAAFPAGEETLKKAARRLVLLGEPGALIPPEPTALVSHVHGQVRAEDPKGGSLEPVIGNDIYNETTIQTGTGSSVELILRDGGILKIGEETRISLRELPAKTAQPQARFSLHEGAVRGRIPGDNLPDYRFATPSAEYRVTGTDLVLEVGKKQTLLSVLEGSVVCRPEQRPSSEVGKEQQLAATKRDLARKESEPLPHEDLRINEKERIEEVMKLLSIPEDGEEIRETTRFWESLNAFKNVTGRIISMDDTSRARLGEELEKRVNPEAIDRSFRVMMTNPDFAALIDSYGIEGIPYP